VLKERVHQAGGTLSGGEQQMLAIGRALMGEPKLLMMDEPSLGLAPILINEIFKIITVLREKKKTILLVEQNARKALLTSDRSYLLENGLIAMSGASSEMINNQKIKDSYLGTR
jgi:branched-chain amino acid transport system ATP-binding protein